MSGHQNPPPTGSEPSLGGENPTPVTGREPGLSSIPRTLTDLPAMLQVRAAERLARTGDRSAKQLLCRILLDGDVSVSLATIQVLGRLKDPDALDTLARVIQVPGFDASIRAAALRAAGQIGGRQGLSVLLDAKNDPDPTVREARVRALGNLGAQLEGRESRLCRHALKALRAAFDDDDPTVREVSVMMVSWVGGEEAHAILLCALTSTHPEVVRAATQLLPPVHKLGLYCRVFRHLPAWLVRDTAHPTLIETLVLTVIVGLLASFIPWIGVFEKVQGAIGLEGQAMPTIVRIALVFQLILGGFAAAVTNRHRSDKQSAALHITKRDRGLLLSGYILAGLYRTRVWFAGIIGVLCVAWPAIATEYLKIPAGLIQTGYAIILWSGISVLVVAASVVITLSPLRGFTFQPTSISVLKLFIILTFVIPVTLALTCYGIALLVSSTSLSLGLSFILVVAFMLAVFWAGKFLLNRFKRRV